MSPKPEMTEHVLSFCRMQVVKVSKLLEIPRNYCLILFNFMDNFPGVFVLAGVKLTSKYDVQGLQAPAGLERARRPFPTQTLDPKRPGPGTEHACECA